jgi:hypothetical protein
VLFTGLFNIVSGFSGAVWKNNLFSYKYGSAPADDFFFDPHRYSVT